MSQLAEAHPRLHDRTVGQFMRFGYLLKSHYLNMHAQLHVRSGARSVIFGMSRHLLPNL